MEYVQRMHNGFTALPAPLIFESLRYVSAHSRPKTAENQAQLLINEGWEIGVEQFVSRLKKSTQAALLSDLVEEDCDTSLIADRLEKELKKNLTGASTATTFKLVSAKLVKTCATELMIDATQELDQLRSQLVDEVIFMGMETLFSLLPRSVLLQYCHEWELEKLGGKSSLVARLLMHLFDLELEDQLGNDEDNDGEKENDTMEVEVARQKCTTANKKKEKVTDTITTTVVAVKKTTTKKKKEKEKKKNDEEDTLESSASDEEEEWERSKKKPKEKQDADVKASKKTTPAVVANKEASKPEPASKRAMSPRTPAATKTKTKKTLQLPEDMKDITLDMKESHIVRKYKIDQIRRCLQMNGLDESGLKPKLAARLHAYMAQLRDGNEENVDPNMDL